MIKVIESLGKTHPKLAKKIYKEFEAAGFGPRWLESIRSDLNPRKEVLGSRGWHMYSWLQSIYMSGEEDISMDEYFAHQLVEIIYNEKNREKLISQLPEDYPWYDDMDVEGRSMKDIEAYNQEIADMYRGGKAKIHSNDRTVNQILEELEDLGFYGIVEGYIAGGFEYGDNDYRDYARDIERARVESTEEELPDRVYRRAHELLRELFGISEGKRTRVKMTISELRQVIRKSILKT